MQPPDADCRPSILPHLPSPTSSCMFTLNISRLIRWLCDECNQPTGPAEIHCSPTGLIFGIPFATWPCKCNRWYKAGDGKVWPGLERRAGVPLSAVAISDLPELQNCAFRALLSPVWITFPKSLDLGEGCEEEVWFHTFYFVCSCFGWRMGQTINSSRDPPGVSATHHWMTHDEQWLWYVHGKHHYQVHFPFHLGLL